MVIKIIPHNSNKIKTIKINNVVFYFIVSIILVILILPWFGVKGSFDLRPVNILSRNINEIDKEISNLSIKVSQLRKRMSKLRISAIELEKSFRPAKPFKFISENTYEIDTLLSEVHKINVLTDTLYRLLLRNESYKFIPAILPVDGWVTKTYGYVRDIFTGERRKCTGIDIVAKEGSKVRATANGTVEFAGYKRHDGLTVIINHHNKLKTKYAHLKKILVKRGQFVKRGKVIGLVGRTGKTVGPTLRYEVYYKGNPQDPMNYILEPLRFY